MLSFLDIIKIHSVFKCFTCWFVVQSLSHVQLFATPWTAACQASLFFAIYQSSLKLMFNELVIPSNHLTFCHPLLLLLPVFPIIRVFSSELALCIRWPKYWGLSCSISPSSEYSGLISFEIDWFDLLQSRELLRVFSSTTVQKHHFLDRHPAFFMVQLSHPYMITGKTIGLTIQTFVSKEISLLFFL